MDFIYTWGLWLGVTDMSGRSLKCFSKCAQRTPCVRIALFGNNSNSQAALEWPPGSDLWGWSLGLCILPPPLVTLIHSRAIGTLVMGGWVGGGRGEELTRGAGSIREKRGRAQVRGRCWPPAHTLPASLLVLLTTWPDPTPGSWLQGEAARTGQGCPPADRQAPGGCPAERRTQVRGQ